jgi:hypothetical protein
MAAATALQPNRNHDYRKALRHERARDIVIYPDAITDRGVAAHLQDVCTFGLGFVQSNPMLVGSEFVLRLELEDGEPQPLLFRVAFCRPITEKSFRIGAQLLRVINGNETIEINAHSGLEFAEAMFDVMAGDPLGRIGQPLTSFDLQPAPADELGWAILVDEQEYVELMSFQAEKVFRPFRIAA